jgi:hypothetical protein
MLMSGTSLAPDAFVTHHKEISAQVAKQLNCSEDTLLYCLRQKSVQELLSVQVRSDFPRYLTTMG